MIAYADTAFVCSIYSDDANSRRAHRRMKLQEIPLPIIWLHQIEVRNAFRLRVFRKEAGGINSNALLNLFLSDFSVGLWQNAYPDLNSVMIEAERLSASYTEIIGSPSLDVLHVAAALVLGGAEFLTFDKRQALLAEAVGLNVPELR
jgi:predicted nucleic acid-binding protein